MLEVLWLNPLEALLSLCCAKSQTYPVSQCNGGAGSGTDASPAGFLPFCSVPVLQLVTGQAPETNGMRKGHCPAATLAQGAVEPPLPMQGEEGALGGYPGSQLCTLGCFLELTAGGEQPRSLGAIWGAFPTQLLHPPPTDPA